jgi:hypothetical protein
MTRMFASATAGLLLIGGCGLKEPLEPPTGEGPPVPAAARTAPTFEEMLTPPPTARPDRVDELLRRSEPRQDDRFDLPPAEVAPGAVPIPRSDDDPDDPE